MEKAGKKISIYEMSVCAVMTAVMCVLGPRVIPIGPVPVSLTNLVLYLTIFLLGTRGTFLSYLIYLLLGAVGLPVFSGDTGGLAKLAGPTGGYLFGFLFMILICGFAVEKSGGKYIPSALAMVLGTVVAYFFGTVWFLAVADAQLSYALSVCVFPFIPFDLAKIAAACILGKQIRRALLKAGVMKKQA